MKTQEQFLAKAGYYAAVFLVVIGLFSSLSPFVLKNLFNNHELYRAVIVPLYGQDYYNSQLILVEEAGVGLDAGQLEQVPFQDVVHRLLGAIFMLIGLTQFSKKYRTKYPKWHRNLGKVFLVFSLFISFGGIVLGIQRPFSGFPETVGVVLIGLIIIFSAVKGYQAARQKKFIIHKLWMVRVFGTALVVSSLRFWFLVFNLTVPGVSDVDIFSAATWMAIVTHLFAIEYYIGLARPKEIKRKPKPQAKPKVAEAAVAE